MKPAARFGHFIRLAQGDSSRAGWPDAGPYCTAFGSVGRYRHIARGGAPFVSGDGDQRTVERRVSTAAILVCAGDGYNQEVAGGMVERTVPRNQLPSTDATVLSVLFVGRVYQDIECSIGITDESMLILKLGLPVALVEGSAECQITTGEKLQLG